MKHVRFSVLLLMAINHLNLNWLQAEDKEASPFVWVDKAAEAYRAGKVKEAVQFADRAVAAEPKNPRLHFFKGQLHIALREYDKSIAAYTKALADAGTLAEAAGLTLGHPENISTGPQRAPVFRAMNRDHR